MVRDAAPRFKRTASGVSELSHDELPDVHTEGTNADPARLGFGDMHVNDAYNEANADLDEPSSPEYAPGPEASPSDHEGAPSGGLAGLVAAAAGFEAATEEQAAVAAGSPKAGTAADSSDTGRPGGGADADVHEAAAASDKPAEQDSGAA